MAMTEIQTPQRGSKQSAQGIALGIVKPRKVALKGQKLHSPYWGERGEGLLMPFQDDGHQHAIKPRTLPWADS